MTTHAALSRRAWWRWIDLRSLRLMSDRMRRMIDTLGGTDVCCKARCGTQGRSIIYYRDLGWPVYYREFRCSIPTGERLAGFISPSCLRMRLTPTATSTSSADDELLHLMRIVQYNPDKGVYEAFPKQGYYNYAPRIRVRLATVSLANTGNSIQRNYYAVLVYYRSFRPAPTNSSAMRWLVR